MKKHILFSILIAIFCCHASLAQKKDKKEKKDTVKVAAPEVVERKEFTPKTMEGLRDEGYDVAVPPMMVEEAPRVYYSDKGNNYSNTNPPNGKTKLDDAGKYYLIRESINGSSYQSKFGIQDSSGKTILPTVFSSITKTEKSYIIKLGNHFGVYDSAFNIVLPTEFEYMDAIGNGLFIVRRKTGGTQLIDSKGLSVVSQTLRNASRFNLYYSKPTNFLQLENNSFKKAIYNTAKKKLETGFTLKSITSFDGGLILVEDTCTRIVDTNFRAITKETFTQVFGSSNKQLLIVSKKNKKGLLGLDGKYLLPCEYDRVDIVNMASMELYIVAKNGKYSFIDYTGKNLFGQSFDYIGNLHNSNYGSSSSAPPLLLVKNNNKVGVKDILNHSIIPVEFDTIYANYSNYYVAQKAKKMVRFTLQGKQVNEISCDTFYSISYDARVYVLSGKMGLMNADFEQVTPPLYSNIEQLGYNGYNSYSSSSYNSYLRVMQNGKMGLMNRAGNIVLSIDYELVEELDRATILVKQNGKYGLFRTNDLLSLAACEYDMIGTPQSSSTYGQAKYVGIKAGEVSYISIKP